MPTLSLILALSVAAASLSSMSRVLESTMAVYRLRDLALESGIRVEKKLSCTWEGGEALVSRWRFYDHEKGNKKGGLLTPGDQIRSEIS